MALAHCILGKFLGVVCHCFPLPLDVPAFAARCLYVHNALNSDFHVNLWIFYVPQIYDVGPTALLPLRRKACWGFFHPKNLMASAGFEPANLDTKGQRATPRPHSLIKRYMWTFAVNCWLHNQVRNVNQVGEKKSGTWYRKDRQVNNLKLATVGKIRKVQGRKEDEWDVHVSWIVNSRRR